MRLRETEQEVEGMKEMDESGIYGFLECAEIARGMLNESGGNKHNDEDWETEKCEGKTQETTSLRNGRRAGTEG